MRKLHEGGFYFVLTSLLKALFFFALIPWYVGDKSLTVS